MPTQATVHHVLIATPSDIGDERSVAKDVVIDWNANSGRKKGIHLEPILFPDHVEPTPQDLDHVDIVIGTFWSRIGDLSEDSMNAASVVRRLAFEQGKQGIVGFSRADVPAGQLDPRQVEAIQQFKTECRDRGLYFTYESTQEYQSQLRQELKQTMAGLLNEQESGFTTKDDKEASEYDPEVDHERLQLSAEIHREQDERNIQRVVDHFEEAGIDPPYRVLDAGCGYGTVTKDRFGNDDRFDVVGIDHIKSVVETARDEYAAPNIDYRWLDVNKLGESDLGTFDFVFSSYLFHHLENQEPVLSLLWDHVVDDGALLVRSCDDGQHLHYPPDQDMDWLVEITDEIKGSSDRRHGRRLYTHVNRLTPAPADICLDLENYHTGGMDSEERRQYWDVFHSNRLHYAEVLAERDEATPDDRELYKEMATKVDRLREKFVDNAHFLDAKSVPLVVAIK